MSGSGSEPIISISERQWMLLTMSAFSAPTLFTIARDLAIGAERQMLWSALILVALAYLCGYLMVLVGSMFPRMDHVGFSRHVLGGWMAVMVNLWWAGFFGSYAGVTLRQFSDVVNTYFLVKTPTEVILFLMVGVAVYVAWHGLEAIARFVAITVPITLVSILAVHLVTLVKASETVAMLPPVGFDPARVLPGAWRGMNVVIGVEAAAGLYAYIRKPKRPFRAMTAAVTMNAVLLLVVVITALGVWGVGPLAQSQYPAVNTLRVLRLPGMLVERLGALIALGWTVLQLGFQLVRLYLCAMTFTKLFGLDHREFRYFLFPTALMILFVARWPLNHSQIERWVVTFFGPVGFLSVSLSPLLIMGVGWLRGKGRNPWSAR